MTLNIASGLMFPKNHQAIIPDVNIHGIRKEANEAIFHHLEKGDHMPQFAPTKNTQRILILQVPKFMWSSDQKENP